MNEDLDVRRRIIPCLVLRPKPRGSKRRELVERATRIAREHPDEYIRHRVEIQVKP